MKSILTSQELEKTIANALKFRELKCDAPGMTILWTMNDSDHKRFVGKPAYFLFAFETQIAKETIRQRLAAESNRSIDAVFILNKGAILDCGDGKGALQFTRGDCTKLQGWNYVSDADSLAHFLLWLSIIPEVHHGGSISSNYFLNALTVACFESLRAPTKLETSLPFE